MTTREDEMVAERLREIVPALEEQWPHAALIVKASLEALTALSSERDLLVEALIEARQFVAMYPVEDKQDLRGKELMLEQIDAALTGVTGG